jgi:hypothetical protein
MLNAKLDMELVLPLHSTQEAEQKLFLPVQKSIHSNTPWYSNSLLSGRVNPRSNSYVLYER